MALQLDRVGLLLCFLSSVLIALSIGQPPSEIYQSDERGRKIQIAAITHPRFLIAGLIMLVLGFFASLAATFAVRKPPPFLTNIATRDAIPHAHRDVAPH
jgi:hypothetical protein